MNTPDAQKKARIEAIVTELELIGVQGAYPVAERILVAIKDADRKHLLEAWNEIGIMGLAALEEFVQKKRL